MEMKIQRFHQKQGNNDKKVERDFVSKQKEQYKTKKNQDKKKVHSETIYQNNK